MSAPEEETPHFSRCYKCNGEKEVVVKRKRVNREDGESRHERVTTVCGVCNGRGGIYGLKKINSQDNDEVVTAPKRPPGWAVPGPQPANLGSVLPAKGEALCYLTGDWRIFQPMGGHRYSTDDLVTAWVAAQEVRKWANVRQRESGCHGDIQYRGLDLGSGLGTVMLMMCWVFAQAKYVSIEAQPVSVDRAKKSAYVNGCHERCDIRLGDLRDYETCIPEGHVFDVVTGTPPYFELFGNVRDDVNLTSLGAGKLDTQRPPIALPAAVDQRPCNFEYRGGVEDYCRAAYGTMNEGGIFVVCEAAGESFTRRVEAAATQVGSCHDNHHQGHLRISRRVDVVPKEGLPPLFSVWVMHRSSGDAGNARHDYIIDTVIVRDRSGARTAQYVSLLADMGMPP